MNKHCFRLKMLSAIIAASALLHFPAFAANTDKQAELILSLDKRIGKTTGFRHPTNFQYMKPGKLADGSYMVENRNIDGRSIKHLSKICKKQKGAFKQILEPRRINWKDDYTIEIETGEGRAQISRNMLIYASQLSKDQSDSYFDSTYYGLFSCSFDDADSWFISIMPMVKGRHPEKGWLLFSRVIQWTPQFVRRIRGSFAVAFEEDKQRHLEEERKWRAKVDAEQSRAEAETASFRANLEIGDLTSCGRVINKRGPLVEIQLIKDIFTTDTRERVWTKVENLSPYRAPNGNRYFCSSRAWD